MAPIKGNEIALHEVFDTKLPSAPAHLVQQRVGQTSSPLVKSFPMTLTDGAWVLLDVSGYAVSLAATEAGATAQELATRSVALRFQGDGIVKNSVIETTGAVLLSPGDVLKIPQGFDRVWVGLVPQGTHSAYVRVDVWQLPHVDFNPGPGHAIQSVEVVGPTFSTDSRDWTALPIAFHDTAAGPNNAQPVDNVGHGLPVVAEGPQLDADGANRRPLIIGWDDGGGDVHQVTPTNAFPVSQKGTADVQPGLTGDNGRRVHPVGWRDGATLRDDLTAQPLPVRLAAGMGSSLTPMNVAGPTFTTVAGSATAPAAGATIADTGQLPAGEYELIVTFASSDTASQPLIIGHRNAANSGDVVQLGHLTANGSAGAQQVNIGRRSFALNERVTVRLGATAGTAAKDYMASIQYRRVA